LVWRKHVRGGNFLVNGERRGTGGTTEKEGRPS